MTNHHNEEEDLLSILQDALEDDPGDADREIRRLGGEGILVPDDIPELSAGVGRVMRLMLDGQWHDALEVKEAAGENGVPAGEGLRRLRDLRRWFEVERERGDGRLWRYRLGARIGE